MNVKTGWTSQTISKPKQLTLLTEDAGEYQEWVKELTEFKSGYIIIIFFYQICA